MLAGLRYRGGRTFTVYLSITAFGRFSIYVLNQRLKVYFSGNRLEYSRASSCFMSPKSQSVSAIKQDSKLRVVP